MKSFLNYILPYRCIGCHRILSTQDVPLCVSCYNQLSWSHEQLDNTTLTAQPLLHHDMISGAASLLIYQHGNIAQKLMHANKYYNQVQIGSFMANFAISLVQDIPIGLVTIVPSHPRTIRKRGYNQVESFARGIASYHKIPFDPGLITRTGRKNSQTHRNRPERMASLQHAFVVDEDINQEEPILLIDDVMTSGATLNVCVSALRKQTSAPIYVLVMARAI